jgi:uncharacterized membrane protein
MALSLELQRETRRLRVLAMIWLGLTIAAAWIWIVLGDPRNPEQLALQALGFLTFPGKYVVFSGLSSSSPLGPWGLAVVGIVAEILLALLLAALLEPLGRLRGVGPWLQRAHLRAAALLADYPGLRRAAFWGVALFVFLPLPGTGAIGGTFAGQMLGLSRVATVLAIVIGTAVTLALFAALAQFLGARAERMLSEPVVPVLSAAVLALGLWLAYRRVKRVLGRAGP